MTQEISFSDFMKYLVALLHEKRIPMPLKDERPWHALFYQLKNTNLGPTKPAFLGNLRFDWDGEYPRCQEVSEFLHALHWNAGVSAINPRYITITLPDEIAKLWSDRIESLDPDAKKMLESIVPTAQNEFERAHEGTTVS